LRCLGLIAQFLERLAGRNGPGQTLKALDLVGRICAVGAYVAPPNAIGWTLVKFLGVSAQARD
jgi:hypothetical protein